ncbi:hypothetical protein [Jannaschia sp. LMIT008]|uniref:hypothetical protein n=1 Tax=Jannaschia maritima TaxID=3032585 RepID=UPI002812080B|nr:hypothetical protein [Jannaschia sp. LMIT008]
MRAPRRDIHDRGEAADYARRLEATGTDTKKAAAHAQALALALKEIRASDRELFDIGLKNAPTRLFDIPSVVIGIGIGAMFGLFIGAGGL